jgi:hypothetical protein
MRGLIGKNNSTGRMHQPGEHQIPQLADPLVYEDHPGNIASLPNAFSLCRVPFAFRLYRAL